MSSPLPAWVSDQTTSPALVYLTTKNRREALPITFPVTSTMIFSPLSSERAGLSMRRTHSSFPSGSYLTVVQS